MRKYLVPAFAALGLIAAILIVTRQPQDAKASIPVYTSVEDVALVTHEGRSARTADWKGGITIVNFIFTSCTHTCPMLTRRMAQLQKKLTGKPGVRLVSISVDPQTDTPAVLKAFGTKHGADFSNWTFYTGDYETIHRLAEKSFLSAMQAASPKKKSLLVDVTHGEHFTAVDASGKIRALKHIQSDEDIDDLVKTVSLIQ